MAYTGLAALNITPLPRLSLDNVLGLASLMRGRQMGAQAPSGGLADFGRSIAPATAGNPGSADLSRALASISRIESGGRYDAMGPVTRSGDRAYGRYQVMGSNVGPWTERWFGQRLTPEEFVANREAQDAAFRGQFGMYMDRYGPQEAASRWFTGRPYAEGRSRTDAIPGVHPGLTGEEYVRRFMAGL